MSKALTRRCLLTAAAALPASCLTAPQRPSPAASLGPMLRGKAIRSDIAILRQAYRELHPGLYRYGTTEDIAVRFDQLEQDFANDQSLAQAYLTLSRFLGTVRCGHTYANFFNQSDAVAAQLFDTPTRIPCHFRWIGGRMVVERNLSDAPALVPGTVILSVDGVETSHILQTILPFARADGSNDDKRRALLEVRGYDRIETFDVFHPQLFYVNPDGFSLRIRTPDGAERRVMAAPHGQAERKAAMRIETGSDGPQWTFGMRGGAAVLTMPTWALYDSTWDWKGWLDERMAEAARTRGLIVDLRGNEGGLDCGNEIIARLIERDIELNADERRVRYRRTPTALDPFLKTWDQSFRDWGDDAVELGDGFYRLRSETGDREVIRARGPRFGGRVAVLTDAQNSSATFQFAERMQMLGLGTVIGQPTGGNQRGINGGAFFFLELPGSGLEADVPLIGRFPRTPRPDAGLTPDVRVDLAADDLASGRDRVMETALQAVA